jgi:hypothetical protein
MPSYFKYSLTVYRLPLGGYLRNWPSFAVSSNFHFVIIHPHAIHCSFMLFDLEVSENKFSLICLTLPALQINSILHFYSSSPHFVYISISSSHCFYGACLLITSFTSIYPATVNNGISCMIIVRLLKLTAVCWERGWNYANTDLHGPGLKY